MQKQLEQAEAALKAAKRKHSDSKQALEQAEEDHLKARAVYQEAWPVHAYKRNDEDDMDMDQGADLLEQLIYMRKSCKAFPLSWHRSARRSGRPCKNPRSMPSDQRTKPEHGLRSARGTHRSTSAASLLVCLTFLALERAAVPQNPALMPTKLLEASPMLFGLSHKPSHWAAYVGVLHALGINITTWGPPGQENMTSRTFDAKLVFMVERRQAGQAAVANMKKS